MVKTGQAAEVPGGMYWSKIWVGLSPFHRGGPTEKTSESRLLHQLNKRHNLQQLVEPYEVPPEHTHRDKAALTG